MKTYRDYLSKKYLEPIVIQRTEKKKGDKVLVSSSKPIQEVTA